MIHLWLCILLLFIIILIFQGQIGYFELVQEQKNEYAKAIEDLIERLGRLPGIGARSAERLAFYLLKSSDDDANGLADAIRKIKTEIHPCRQCSNLAEQELVEAINRGWVSITRPWHLLTTNAGAANPHAATAEKGHQLMQVIVDRLAGFLVELSEAEQDDRFPY